jgi:hypothetical protein
MNLLLTSANLNCQYRSKSYIDSFNRLEVFSSLFSNIFLVETVSYEDCDYLKEFKYKKFFSNIGNPFAEKGYNWARHMENFLNLTPEEHFIFLTGRYKILNDNLIKFASDNQNCKIIAKNDKDIYSGNGVHMFYFYFQKSELLKFLHEVLSSKDKSCPIEWKFKNFISKSKDCVELPINFNLGVETDISNGIVMKV